MYPLFKFVLAFNIAANIAIARILGCKSPTFQAIAHFVVCWLFCSAYYTAGFRRWSLFALGLALTIVETVCFVFKI